jgi:hypothetical protein
VNLWISSFLSPDDDNTYIPILTQLMPMIGNGNINSMSMSIWQLYHHMVEVELGPNNAASQVLTTMLTNARILDIKYGSKGTNFIFFFHLFQRFYGNEHLSVV